MCEVDQIGVSSHFSTKQVQGFYTTTLLYPGLFADLSTKFSLDRGLKPLQESLFPIASLHHKTYSADPNYNDKALRETIKSKKEGQFSVGVTAVIDGKAISISLFSGAFGLDLGLELAGFHTVSVVEKDRDSVKTIALNRPYLHESAIPRAIETISTQDLLLEGGRVLGKGRALRPNEVDLVVGGAPCQPFST